MKPPTPFYKLAEKIGNDIDGAWFCCVDIEPNELDAEENAIKFFKELFKPTEAEQEEYELNDYAWMGGKDQSRAENNAGRIIALLLADQIWKDEHKSNLKKQNHVLRTLLQKK